MHKMRMAVLVSVLAGLLLAALPASASAGLAGRAGGRADRKPTGYARICGVGCGGRGVACGTINQKKEID